MDGNVPTDRQSVRRYALVEMPAGWHVIGASPEPAPRRERRTLEQAISDLRAELAELESAYERKRRRSEGQQDPGGE